MSSARAESRPWALSAAAALALALGVACAHAPPDASERRGDLLLACEPADARIVLDGVEQGTCADYRGGQVGLRLSPGMHRVEVRREGYWPWVTYVEPGGARAALRATLLPLKVE